MKQIITAIVLLALGYLCHGQVIITEQANPTPTNSSVLLEFGSQPKGIILPSVASAPGAVGGTFIVNTTDGAVQYNNGTTWVNLTDLGGLKEHSYTNAGTDTGEGTIIGSTATTKPGVLVLESKTQALVLPRVANPHLNILSPIAGTVVYDTTSDAMAVYDGEKWSYWAAKDNLPPANPAGTGSLYGRTCFDVVRQYIGPECGDLASRLPQQADFAETNTADPNFVWKQTYTFKPLGSAVSNVRFVYVDPTGKILQSLVADADYTGNNISTATATATYYQSSLNTAATGLSREAALKADIYVIYNNSTNNTGTDVQLKLTVNVQDCPCCGAYIAPGVWKEFMCHNLGADMTADPFTPAKAIHGAKYQWGARTGETGRYISQADDQNAAYDASFPGWIISTFKPSGSWNVATKGIDDPCPTGFRVPSTAELNSIKNNNVFEMTGGVWNVGTYTTGLYWKPTSTGPRTLFMPAAGARATAGPGSLEANSRGAWGRYWTSNTAGNGNSSQYFFSRAFSTPAGTPGTGGENSQRGLSVRCISEN